MVAQSTVTSTHSFLKFQYLRRSTYPGRIEVTGPCGIDTSAESPGNPITIFSSTELIIDPAPPGFYHVTVNTVPPGSPVSGQSVYVYDENGFQQAHDLAAPGSFDHGHIYYTSYSFTFNQETIQPNQSNRFNIVPLRECLATRFSTAGQVTLRITEGMQFGQFYRVEFVFFPDFEIRYIPLGTEITAYSNQFQEIDYLADGDLPPPGGGRVVVQSEWGGVFEADTFYVQTPGSALDHFAVSLEKDTIAFTETSKIFVQAKNASNGDINIDGNTLLRFSIDSSQYGSFIKANGDTVRSPLTSVLYGDAMAGNIRFAAVNKNPDSVVSFKVIAKLQEDTTKAGDTTMVLWEQTLKIVMIGDTVQPIVPPTEVNNPEPKNRKDFAVRMTRAGKPMASHPFRITTDYIDRSGGHEHVTNRRLVTRENYGHFILRRTNTHHDRPYEGQTQSDGKEQFDYVASIWGDTIKVMVQSTDNLLLRDTVRIAERIPGLAALQSGTNNVITYTSTQDFHLLVNSNYGTAGTLSVVNSAVNQYAQEYGMENDIFLAVIDMSLPLGGGFDIRGGWERDVSGQQGAAGHHFHRVGKSLDFSHFYRDENRAVITVEIFIDGELRQTTNQIDEAVLDARFDRLSFDRWERSRGLIHYESRN